MGSNEEPPFTSPNFLALSTQGSAAVTPSIGSNVAWDATSNVSIDGATLTISGTSPAAGAQPYVVALSNVLTDPTFQNGVRFLGTSGAWPTGVSMATDGLITVSPEAAGGPASVTMDLWNGWGNSISATFVATITAPPP